MVLMVGAVFCIQSFCTASKRKRTYLLFARSKNVFEVMLMSSSELNISQVVCVFFLLLDLNHPYFLLEACAITREDRPNIKQNET